MSYFYRDEIGSVEVTSDGSGGSLARYAYSAWGKARLVAGDCESGGASRAYFSQARGRATYVCHSSSCGLPEGTRKQVLLSCMRRA